MVEYILIFAMMAAQFINAGAQAAHNTTHTLKIREAQGTGICSSTAIDHHKLLTATHCVVDGQAFKVDDKLVNVSNILDDGADHSILTVDMNFPEFAIVNLGGLKQGDHVYMWGNPDGLPDQYREGYVTGTVDGAQTLDLNGYFGDSGAGLFNEKGEVVGVVSIINNATHGENGPSFKLMGAFPLRFTPAQVMAERLCSDCR